MLLLQFLSETGGRHVGILNENGSVAVLEGVNTTYQLALRAIEQGRALADLAPAYLGETRVAYETLYRQGRVCVPLDHPDPAHCLVSGTGLTHLGSADARDTMHRKLTGEHAADHATLTDSMKMFRMGIEGGKPARGQIGVQPEWFYKGNGNIVRACGTELSAPAFALDGGEEPEIAAMYVIAPDGTPCRVGYALGNEFSDHVIERENYLWLAHSKLRECAIGPALWLGPLPDHVEGTSRVLDVDGNVRWSRPFLSGEANMSHTLANLEHHHFKYAQFRQPGDVHIHFFGTATLSFADGIRVAPGESFEIEVPGFGPALRNKLAWDEQEDLQVRAL